MQALLIPFILVAGAMQAAGAGMLNGLIISANLVASLAIEHFGLLGAPQHPISLARVGGAALMIGGVTLISRF